MLTTRQAILYTKLLFSQFQSNWKEIFSFHFSKIFSGSSVRYNLPDGALPVPMTIQDLALIVLYTDTHQKSCLKLLRSVLSKQQLFVLYKETMEHAKRSLDDERKVEKMLRSDTLVAKIFNYLITPVRKRMAKNIKSDCNQLTDAISSDIIRDGPIPNMIPPNYVMSPSCVSAVIELFKKIDAEIFRIVSNKLLIRVLLASFIYYLSAQRLRPEEIFDILCGSLSNRVIGPVLHTEIFKRNVTVTESSSLSSIKRKNVPEEDPRNVLKMLIGNRYLTKVYAFILSTVVADKDPSLSSLPDELKSLMPAAKEKYQNFLKNIEPSLASELPVRKEKSVITRTEVRDVPKPVLYHLLFIAFVEECSKFAEIKEQQLANTLRTIFIPEQLDGSPFVQGIQNNRFKLNKKSDVLNKILKYDDAKKKLVEAGEQYRVAVSTIFNTLFTPTAEDLPLGLEQLKEQVHDLINLTSETDKNLAEMVVRINWLETQLKNVTREPEANQTSLVAPSLSTQNLIVSPPGVSQPSSRSTNSSNSSPKKKGFKAFILRKDQSLKNVASFGFFDISQNGKKNEKNGSKIQRANGDGQVRESESGSHAGDKEKARASEKGI